MSRNLLKATGKSRVELGWVLRLLCPSLVLGLDTISSCLDISLSSSDYCLDLGAR